LLVRSPPVPAFKENAMTTSQRDAATWATAGRVSTAESLTLRYAAVLNGLFDSVLHEGLDWFLVDRSGRLVDCSALAHGATGLLGAPLSKISGGIAAEALSRAWDQILIGRVQTVWPWQGGRARADMRSLELHPIRDVLSADEQILGALVVLVDETSRLTAPDTTAQRTAA